VKKKFKNSVEKIKSFNYQIDEVTIKETQRKHKDLVFQLVKDNELKELLLLIQKNPELLNVIDEK